MVSNKHTFQTAQEAVLKTLTYSSIFHFPLTKEELWKFLIATQPITKDEFNTALHTLSPELIITKSGFYSLAENSEDITNRSSTDEVEKKMQIAKRAAYYLSFIPTIKLIGLSGSLAMGKAERTDDIDLFIVTKKNTLFMTRLWVNMVLEMLSVRRKRLETIAEDKVCANLLVDERELAWPNSRHDMYTAHEILQMKPLFDRDDTYRQFREQNQWIRKFFPNAEIDEEEMVGAAWKKRYVTLSVLSSLLAVGPLEKLAAKLQKRYMKRHQTTEVITDRLLAFHPVDYRSKTLSSLNTKLQQLGLLTKF